MLNNVTNIYDFYTNYAIFKYKNTLYKCKGIE